MLTATERNAWSAALRSGTYRQLYGRQHDKTDGRCVLGVFAEITPGRRIKELWYTRDYTVAQYFGEAVHRNDNLRQTFAEIADWIDAGMPLGGDHAK